MSLQLHNLSSLVKKRKRVGRGGSRGGTSGKGHKGQKARTGHHGVGIGFEGGQMPLARRLPKVGFNNSVFKKEFQCIDLNDIEKHFSVGDEIKREHLIAKGLIKPLKSKKSAYTSMIKLLGDGTLSKKVTIYVDAASKQAQASVEQTGGTIVLTKEM